jgi:heptosyltransferase-2
MKILIIKIGALGDVVRSSFIAQALYEKYYSSQPKITWVTSDKARPFFVNNAYVSEILPESEKEKIKNNKYDLIINLEEDEENCKFVSKLNCRKILGFYYDFSNGKIVSSPSAKEWYDMSVLGEKPKNNILKKENKKTLRQILGEIIEVKNWIKYQPFLRLTNPQRVFAANFLRRHNLTRKDIILGINTGSADRWPKQLSIEKTAKLIDLLSKKYKAKILLFGGPNEIERNRQIIAKSHSHIIDTGCGNDLVEFPALISVCSLFITTDSLGVHVSLALKRKTICLLGPTSSNEVDMYGFGEKVVADSKCLCCYKSDCKSMEKISLKKIIQSVDNLLNEKITLLITAFKEPNIGKAIESALNQKTEYDYEILISVPDKPTRAIAQSYAKNNPKIKIFNDPGKGKSYALNMIFKSVDTDILILTDGDVFISENSLQDIVDLFKDPEVGCLTGRPMPIEDRKTKYGFWANFLFEAAHRMRKEAYENNNFLECSGYLFAFRKKMITQIPLDTAEDSIIPYLFWQKGYKIGYAQNAKVFVKNVDNWKDWISQKTRTSHAHETLSKYVDTKTTPRAKTFKNEAKGISMFFTYPNGFKEYYWALKLVFARFFMWINVFYQLHIKKKTKVDNWKRVESAR